jgi:hypothetical protein
LGRPWQHSQSRWWHEPALHPKVFWRLTFQKFESQF